MRLTMSFNGNAQGWCPAPEFHHKPNYLPITNRARTDQKSKVGVSEDAVEESDEFWKAQCPFLLASLVGVRVAIEIVATPAAAC